MDVKWRDAFFILLGFVLGYFLFTDKPPLCVFNIARVDGNGLAFGNNNSLLNNPNTSGHAGL